MKEAAELMVTVKGGHMAKDIEKILDEILKKLDGWGMFEVLDIRQKGKQTIVQLDVEGDWKHAHGYADSLFEDAGMKLKSVDAEDSDDDWYEAVHTYVCR